MPYTTRLKGFPLVKHLVEASKRGQHGLDVKTGMMITVQDHTPSPSCTPRFRILYDIVNEGSWMGNSPVGAINVGVRMAIRAVTIFPRMLPGLTMSCYNSK